MMAQEPTYSRSDSKMNNEVTPDTDMLLDTALSTSADLVVSQPDTKDVMDSRAK